MFGLGPWELIAVFVVVLLVFGPKRLPEMGRSLGQGIREFRKAGKEIHQDIAGALKEENTSPQPKPAQQPDTLDTGQEDQGKVLSHDSS